MLEFMSIADWIDAILTILAIVGIGIIGTYAIYALIKTFESIHKKLDKILKNQTKESNKEA